MAKLPCFITAESADSPRCIVSEKFDFSPRIHTRAGTTRLFSTLIKVLSSPRIHTRAGTTRSVDGEQIVHRPHPHAHGNNDRQNYQNGTFEHTPTRARE